MLFTTYTTTVACTVALQCDYPRYYTITPFKWWQTLNRIFIYGTGREYKSIQGEWRGIYTGRGINDKGVERENAASFFKIVIHTCYYSIVRVIISLGAMRVDRSKFVLLLICIALGFESPRWSTPQLTAQGSHCMCINRSSSHVY